MHIGSGRKQILFINYGVSLLPLTIDGQFFLFFFTICNQNHGMLVKPAQTNQKGEGMNYNITGFESFHFAYIYHNKYH